ncbi:MAG: hypothetical protein FJW36_02110 [Acidobacteria bacterium]|nr:hypothetical protein [Acidobacteriota bacterium]
MPTLILSLISSLVLASTAFAQAPPIGGVLNAADFSRNLSSRLLVAVFGTNVGTGPTSSVTITVGGRPATVLVVTANQLTVQLPVDVPAGATTMTTTVSNTSSAPFAITLAAHAPAFLAADGSGAGTIVAIDATTNARLSITAPAKIGDTVSAFAVGLGPTTPVTPTGGTAANPLPVRPVLTVGGVPAEISYAGGAGIAAAYQINFKVPPNVQGSLPIKLTIGGVTNTANVSLPVAGIGAVTNNASLVSSGSISAGSIVSIFANGIGTTTQTTGFPSTTFQGYSVLINGVPAPLFYLGGTVGQINALVPYELPPTGTVNVQLRTPTGTLGNFPVTVAAATPGLYTIADPAVKTRINVIAQFSNTAWLAMPDSMAAALKIPGNCAEDRVNAAAICGQPAAAGDFLVLYTTGLGKATPDGDPNGAQLRTGDIPPVDGRVLYRTVETPSITLGGIGAQVLYSGIVPGFPGLYQVNFQVPAGITGDDVPLVLTMGGNTDTRTIAIKQKN